MQNKAGSQSSMQRLIQFPGQSDYYYALLHRCSDIITPLLQHYYILLQFYYEFLQCYFSILRIFTIVLHHYYVLLRLLLHHYYLLLL